MTKSEEEQQQFEEMTLAIAQKYIDGEITRDIAIADMKTFLNSYHPDGEHDDRSAWRIVNGSIEEIRRNTVSTNWNDSASTSVMTMEEIAIERLQEEVADLKYKQEAMSAFLRDLLYVLHTSTGSTYSDLFSKLVAELQTVSAVFSGIHTNIKDDGIDEDNNITE